MGTTVVTVTSTPFNFSVKTAYNYFGDGGRQKMFKMVRPLLRSSEGLSLTINVDYDFKQVTAKGGVTVSSGAGSLFDVALWDVNYFSASSVYFQDWVSLNGIGFCASLQLSGQSNSNTLEWNNFAISYEPGGVI